MTIQDTTISTPRLRTRVRSGGREDGPLVLLIHGNVSSADFWDEAIAGLGDRYRVLAPDLRGFGGSEPAPIDATRGVRDFSDDVAALLDAVAPGQAAHVVGWSMGGGVALQLAIDHPRLVRSIILQNPVSPVGFGGTRDAEGNPCSDDFAGSGGGTASPDFVRLLRDKDRGADGPTSPRSVLNTCYFKPPFRVAPAREEALLDAMLAMHLGDDHYPGDGVASPHWPGLGPGDRGINNTMSPKHLDLRPFAAIEARPPVLWIRGADDIIVSDTSLFDLGFLGQLGAIPGWPGAETFPPQPMVSQMRAVLDRYRAAGGQVQEVVFDNCGHSPHLEQGERWLAVVGEFLGGV